jgi:uncharacterized protein (DUF433 family)
MARRWPVDVASSLDRAYTILMASLAIDVIYENGVFRPVEPVSLPEGSHATVYAPGSDRLVITKTPGVCGGRACIAGTRITVWGIAAYHRDGLDEQAILDAIPHLHPAELRAALRYAEENAEEIARDIAANTDSE